MVVKALGIMTLGTTTFSITTLRNVTLRIKGSQYNETGD
jgi:hypothetical protein